MPDERTVLIGDESTGLHAVDGVGSFHCIMSNFEHTGDREKSLRDKLKDTLASFVRAFYNDRYAGAVGYLAITPSARAHSGNQS